MMSSDFIIEVSEENFEFEVLTYSQNVPVVVDFWAAWCRPCKQLSPMLEALATKAHGAFRLAKVDVDQNPNLALRYGVRSLPTVKAFAGGQVVGELVGLQPVDRVQEFLAKLEPPSALNLALEKAQGSLDEHLWEQAEQTFRGVLEEAPENTGALLGLAKALLAQGESGEPAFILKNFPASPQYKNAELLRPLADALSAYEAGSLPDETDLDAAFNNSLRMASRGKFLMALDGLLDILRQNKHYGGDKARQVFVALLEILGEEDPETGQYRAELASILF
jgi:putative thioredoxin